MFRTRCSLCSVFSLLLMVLGAVVCQAVDVSFSQTLIEVKEGVGILTFTLLKTEASVGPVSVQLLTVDESARGGVDFSTINRTITFDIGVTKINDNLLILDDDVLESVEQLSLQIGPVPGLFPVSLTNSNATVFIQDNDVAVFSFKEGAYDVSEEEEMIEVEVALSRRTLDRVVEIQLSTIESSAIGGTDFIPLTMVLVFDKDTSSITVPIIITDDVMVEEKESFSASLSLVNQDDDQSVILGRSETVITITDSDSAEIDLVGDKVIVREGEGNARVSVRVISGQLGGEVNLVYSTFNINATGIEDYIPVSRSIISLSPSVSFQERLIEIVDDSKYEDQDEVFLVQISLLDGKTAERISIQTSLLQITIKDNDFKPRARVRFAVRQQTTFEEVGRMEILVTSDGLNPNPILLDYSYTGGSARAGVDVLLPSGSLMLLPGAVLANIVVRIIDDTTPEPEKSFRVGLRVKPSQRGAVTLGLASTQITIVDSDVTDCGSLGNPENGLVHTPTGTTEESVATYSCNDGYVPVGATGRICRASGIWTPDPPTCELVSPPPPPNGLVTAPDYTSAHLSWIQDGKVDFFFLTIIRSDVCAKSSQNVLLAGDLRSYAVTDLEEDGQYLLTVLSITSAGNSSADIFFTTLSTSPSGPPLSFRLREINSTFITLDWDEVSCLEQNGPITGYSVSYSQAADFATPLTLSTSNQFITVTGLDTNQDYLFRVAAVNSVGKGPYTTPLLVRTQRNQTDCTTNAVPCQYGSLRLRDGTSPLNGRVEVCFLGVWGTVCSDSWDATDANVACRQLGFLGSGAKVVPVGSGTGPIFLNNVKCTGNEERITDCESVGFCLANCEHTKDAGIMCRQDIGECADPLLNNCNVYANCANSEGNFTCSCLPGHADAVSAVINCSSPSACRFDTHRCPSNSDCEVNCLGTSACRFNTIHCPAGSDCTVNCPGNSSCQFDTIRCLNNSDCEMNCPGTSACRYGTIHCPAGGDCTVNCSGIKSCQFRTMNCSTNDDCTLDCPGDSSCQFKTIHCPNNSDCTVGCSGMESCRHSTIHCPASPHKCVINCGNAFTCQNLNIVGASSNLEFNCCGESSCSGANIEPTSRTCTDIGECADPLLNNCNVNANCANSEGNITCSCRPGYTGDGVSCTDIDECTDPLLNNCPVNASCENTEGSFMCTCFPGMIGNGVTCNDAVSAVINCSSPSACQFDTHRCPSNSDCEVNCLGTSACLFNTIHCPAGSDCTVNCPGNSTCRFNTIHCPAGGDCTVNCSGIKSCQFHRMNCSTNDDCTLDCPGDSSCLFETIHCPNNSDCTVGCSGMESCRHSTIHCPASPHKCVINCGNAFTCQNLNIVGASSNLEFNCCGESSCSGANIEPTSRTCTDIGECADPLLNNCNVNANCANSEGNITCSCRPGYTGDGVSCTDIDECTDPLLNNCPVNASCENTEGSFMCTCFPGMIGNGVTCNDAVSTVINCSSPSACQFDTHRCPSNSDCEVNCLGTSACLLNTIHCPAGSDCTVNCPGNSTCRFNTIHCPAGGDCTVNCSGIKSCQFHRMNCSTNDDCTLDCSGDSSCLFETIHCPNNSDCTVGCSGMESCQLSTIHCPASPHKCVINCGNAFTCQNLNIVGVSSNLEFNCCGESSCSGANIEPTSRTCTDIGECADPLLNNCNVNANCANSEGNITCSCRPGYTGDGVSCTDIDECTDPLLNNCPVNASCENTEGSFMCTCFPGVIGNGVTCNDAVSAVINCSSPSACVFETLRCPGNSDCEVNCSGTAACQFNTMHCPAGSDCTVNCPGNSSCQFNTIQCNNNSECEMNCPGNSSCQFNTIQCPTNGDCTLNCPGYSSCLFETIHCPNNSDCTVNCPGNSSCQFETIHCPNNSDCEMNCPGTSACRFGTIHCPAGSHCTVNCSGIESCQFHTINCSTNSDCTLDCSGDSSCLFETIHCPNNSDCTVGCSGMESCQLSTIHCPASPHKCVINCGNAFTCQNLNIVGASSNLEFNCCGKSSCSGANIEPTSRTCT